MDGVHTSGLWNRWASWNRWAFVELAVDFLVSDDEVVVLDHSNASPRISST